MVLVYNNMNHMEEKRRIIIIEDDIVLRDVLSEKLEKNGYIVDRAADGVIGMQKIREMKPDCILLDILMPNKNGIEVMEELHADPSLKDIPVIIISNSGQPVEIQRAQELGAREFLIKAIFDPNEVLEKVSNVLKKGNTVSTGDESAHAQGAQKTETIGSSKDNHAIAPPSADLSHNTSKKKKDNIFILVIEDDKFLRELLVRKLTGEGFDVQNAIEAGAAFQILSQRKPNIVLLDLILPGVDGFEILSRIKADPKISDIPVIILSNLGQKEDLDKAMALGAKDFMVKANFTLDEIVKKVNGIV